VEETARPVASPDADVGVGRHDGHPAVGWSLAGAGPVDGGVIGILAEGGVVEVPAPMRRMRSMHSRRALAIHRSQIDSHAVHGPAL
jgi:hypothetical protein